MGRTRKFWILDFGFWICALLVALPAQAAPTRWQTLTPGVEYTEVHPFLNRRTSVLHAFRIDLTKYRLDVALAKDYRLPTASAREYAERTKAVVAINGGFFSPENQPLGLRIQRGKIRSKLKNTSWWGVFSVRGNKARIDARRDYRPSKRTTMAVQVGPRLVINGAIPKLKDGTAERSALCVTPNGRVIIAVTHNAPMRTTKFAELLRGPAHKGGLGCRNALNLDGGRSSQLYARIGKFKLHVPNLSAVTDAVVVVPK